MNSKRIVFIVITVITLAVTLSFTGCSDKLEEPVFVKELVCSADMDADVDFITDNDFELKAVGVEIPNIPEDLSLTFYDETVDEYKGYDLHSLNFGIGTDNLNECGGLSEPFIFHEIIVKWDDGSETKADIGTIHMMEGYELAYNFDWTTRKMADPGKDLQTITQDHQVTEDLTITSVEIPYYEEYSDLVKDITIAGRTPDDITADNPLVVEKGHTYMMKYNVDTKVDTKYGTMFIECKIIGTDKQGNEHINMFYIQGNEDRTMPDWMLKQIKKAEQ